jgi:hypothetical protein
MAPKRAVPPIVLSLAFTGVIVFIALVAACGRESGPKVSPASSSSVPAASPAPPGAVSLVEGLKLTLVPYLHGVSSDDFPETARRDVEILSFEKGHLKLRWTATVRVEKPESARRREDWVRARSNAPQSATPEPVVAPEYENRSVTGTLLFPDFGKATEFLLPGLWPEGNVTLPGTSAMWIPAAALADLRGAGKAEVPFHVSSRLLKEPASGLLQRASGLAGGRPGAGEAADPPERWRDVPSEKSYALKRDGVEVSAPMRRARNWFGVYEILDDDKNPLVLSVLPDPPSGPLLDLFAPANVLKTLLGYRVAAVEMPMPLDKAGK